MPTIQTYYIGSTDNAAGITPDFATLNDWIDDSSTVTDLVTNDLKVFLYLLPGELDEDTGFTLTGTTDSTRYFTILPYPGFEFIGDTTTDVPIITNSAASTTGIVRIEAQYTSVKNIIVKGTANVTLGLASTGVNSVVDSCGIIELENSVTTSTNGMFLVDTIVRNCIVKDITTMSATSATTTGIIGNVIAYNNLLENITAVATSTFGAVVNGINLLKGCANNNVIINLSANSETGPETQRAITGAGTSDYNAYDATSTTVPGGSNSVLIDDTDLEEDLLHVIPGGNLDKTGLNVQNNLCQEEDYIDGLSVIASNFNYDIEGHVRKYFWNIGPDQILYGTGGNTASTSLDQRPTITPTVTTSECDVTIVNDVPLVTINDAVVARITSKDEPCT